METPMESFESFVHPKPRFATTIEWQNCPTAGELAESIHKAAIAQLPTSEYVKLYGRPN
jgi:hypothetical protein